jgi:DNA-binding NtrC family response regulator
MTTKSPTEKSPKILLVDDNPQVLDALALLFTLDGYQSVLATDPATARTQFEHASAISQPFDLVVQDMNFSSDTTGGAEGLRLFAELRALNPDIPIVLLTAWTHLEQAVELVKAGAADYLAKPWQDEKLRISVRNLLELSEQRTLAARLSLAAQNDAADRAQALSKIDLRGGLFVSSAMQALVQMAARVAPSDVAVLISGPNGAGKERIAEIVHYNSSVKNGNLVVLNCGALPVDLIEAELFGADAGAYTGAAKAREGRFEAADGGTLFLDEIGNLSLSGQMKLLRVLETGRFERLGSTKTRQVKVRVISATNADLPAQIRAGLFREDLYYRLNVVPLVVPPLHERVADIVPLARSFLQSAAIAHGVRLSAAAQAALKRHSWPGNVRELRNVITRASLMCANQMIEPNDLALPIESARVDAAAMSLEPANAREPNRAELEAALLQSGNVVADAAAALCMTRQSLYRRMERFGIARGER